MNFEIPDTKVVKISNAEKFTECLRIALKECECTNFTYNKFGPITLEFADGSTIGCVRMWYNAGLLPADVLEPIKWPK